MALARSQVTRRTKQRRRSWTEPKEPHSSTSVRPRPSTKVRAGRADQVDERRKGKALAIGAATTALEQILQEGRLQDVLQHSQDCLGQRQPLHDAVARGIVDGIEQPSGQVGARLA